MNSIRNISIVLALLLVPVAAMSAEVKSADGSFSVNAPVELKSDKMTLQTSAGDIQYNIYAGEALGRAYMLLCMESPEPLGSEVNDSLSEICDTMLKMSKHEFTTKKKEVISQDGHSGLAFEAVTPENGRVLGRLYVAGNRIYFLMIVSRNGTIDRADADFLKSFKILK